MFAFHKLIRGLGGVGGLPQSRLHLGAPPRTNRFCCDVAVSRRRMCRSPTQWTGLCQNPVDGFFSLPLSSIPRRHLGKCGKCLVTRKIANSWGGAAEITLLPSQWCQAQPSCPRCPPALSVGHVTMTDLGVCKVKLFLPVPYTNRSGLLLHAVSILN